MNVYGILPFARHLLEKAIPSGGIAVDCTVGNGHDTLFLAQLVGKSGVVYGFDIQELALNKTREKLLQNDATEQVRLFLAGHEHLEEKISAEHAGKVNGAIFNLGYLPGSDKAIVTKPETTIAAIEQLLSVMTAGGIIVIVIYHGHEEGKTERDAVVSYAEQLDQRATHVLRYQFINQANNPPFIIVIEKR